MKEGVLGRYKCDTRLFALILQRVEDQGLSHRIRLLKHCTSKMHHHSSMGRQPLPSTTGRYKLYVRALNICGYLHGQAVCVYPLICKYVIFYRLPRIEINILGF